MVKRTHKGNFPIYCETRKKLDRTYRLVTAVGNVYGNLLRSREDLRIALGVDCEIKTRKVLVSGNREDKLKKWLAKLGF